MINNKIKLGLALLELKGFGRAKARALIESMEQIPNTAGEAIEALNRYVSQTGKKLPEFNDTTLQVAMGSAARETRAPSVDGRHRIQARDRTGLRCGP